MSIKISKEKFIFFFLAFVMFFSWLVSQAQFLGDNPLGGGGTVKVFNNNDVGSERFLTPYQKGYYIEANGGRRKEVYLKYDTFNEDLYIQDTSGKDMVIYKGYVSYFNFNFRDFKFLENVPGINFTYGEIIYEGHFVKVYRRHHRIKNVTASDKRSSYEEQKEYINDDQLIWEVNGDKILIYWKKRDLEKLLNKHVPANKQQYIKSLLKEYDAKDDIKIKNLAADLDRLFL